MKIKLFLLFSFLTTINCLDKEKDCKCRILPESKIIGGKEAHHLAYPWVVSLSQKKDETPVQLRKFVNDEEKINFHFCGGSIINEYFILTNVLCVSFIFNPLYIGYGNDLVNIFDSGRNESYYSFYHQKFFYEIADHKIYNDIALVKLKKPINFSKDIKPACLLNEDKELYTGYLSHVGWGSTEIIKKNIRKREASVFKNNRKLKEIFLFDQSDSKQDCKLNKNIICAKGINENESSCEKDSGSPLHYTKNGKSYVVGLASYSIDQYFENDILHTCLGTTAFTRISKYMSWIKNYTGDDICEF